MFLLLSLTGGTAMVGGASAGGSEFLDDSPAGHSPSALAAAAPLPAAAEIAGYSLDPRRLPWAALRRVLLEAGIFLPPYQPVSRAEIAALLEQARRQLPDDVAGEELPWRQYWLDRTDGESLAGSRLCGRILQVYSKLGEVLSGEAGFDAPGGWSLSLEPEVVAWSGRWWLAAAPRLRGRLGRPSAEAPPALLYAGWPAASARPVLGQARSSAGKWRLDWPVLAAGACWGRWAVTAGWLPRQTGPGVTGGLALDATAPSFPAVTVRRTAPFAWRGFARHLAPQHLLLRAGRLDGQVLGYEAGWRRLERRDNPWFLQWLLTFAHTSWLRTTVSGSALALPRDGTLWPDLLEVGFPLLSATWAETERGPLTDRIFSLQFEARFRNAPWPLLPSAAGRVYWEYAGEDFIPHQTLRVIPQIAAPASLIGIELVDPVWDLAFEYAELEHPEVLWYAHSEFRGGYSHRDWILGHPLGGGGESWTGWLRWRPGSAAWEAVLQGGRSTSGERGRTPAVMKKWTCGLTLRRALARVPTSLSVLWQDETVTPLAEGAASGAQQWWRVLFQIGH